MSRLLLEESALCGPKSLAMWSMVVGAGILDQCLGVIRLMRLVRVIKVIALMLESGLSWKEGAGFQSFNGGVIAVNALLMTWDRGESARGECGTIDDAHEALVISCHLDPGELDPAGFL